MAKTWKELHELDNLQGVQEELSYRQSACIKFAQVINVPQFLVTEAKFDLSKASELSEKLNCSTKIAEYLDVTYHNVSTEDIGLTATNLYLLEMEEMLKN